MSNKLKLNYVFIISWHCMLLPTFFFCSTPNHWKSSMWEWPQLARSDSRHRGSHQQDVLLGLCPYSWSQNMFRNLSNVALTMQHPKKIMKVRSNSFFSSKIHWIYEELRPLFLFGFDDVEDVYSVGYLATVWIKVLTSSNPLWMWTDNQSWCLWKFEI